MDDLEEIEEGLDALMKEDPQVEQEYMDLLDEKERRQKIEYLRENLKQAQDMEDEDFARELLREVAAQARVILEIMSGEIEADPAARSVEVVADLVDSVNNTLKSLLDLGIDKKKLELDERKIGLKEQENQIGGGDTNILVVGSAKDLGDFLESGDTEQIEEVEAEVIEEEG